MVSGLISFALSITFFLIVLSVPWQIHRYHEARRDVVHDQQPIFYSPDAFHVTTLLKLNEGQDLLESVGAFVNASETSGAKVIYAGKVVVNALQSAQLPSEDWDAFVLTQYETRAAYDEAAASAEYTDMRNAFSGSYALGMKRHPAENLAIPLVLLAKRAIQLIRRDPPRYPFTPNEVTGDISPERLERRDAFVAKLLANTEYGKDALVVLNFLKNGTPEQEFANADYGDEMFGLMAELGIGPMHMGTPVTLEGNASFDQIAIVYYPGTLFFAEMVQSTFYTDISGDKQLGDTLSSPSVPLLPHL